MTDLDTADLDVRILTSEEIESFSTDDVDCVRDAMPVVWRDRISDAAIGS